MWKTPPYGQKTLLKSKKNIFQISHLIFWKLQAAKYLIYDFTFTLSFFFIWSKLNWTLFHLSGIFWCEKMIHKVEISVWNIWIWRKWETKFRNPKWQSSHCSCCIVHWRGSHTFWIQLIIDKIIAEDEFSRKQSYCWDKWSICALSLYLIGYSAVCRYKLWWLKNVTFGLLSCVSPGYVYASWRLDTIY